MTRHAPDKPFAHWLPANQSFYLNFRQWLREGGYGPSALNLYGIGARIALGFLDKPYWLIDPSDDIREVQEYLAAQYPCEATRAGYAKGILKLQQYLFQRCHRPRPEPSVNWDYYLGMLPVWIADDVCAYVRHCWRAWPLASQHCNTIRTLGCLTRSLRWIAGHVPLASIADVTPAAWFDYLDTRLALGIKPVTTNSELHLLQSFLIFLRDQDRTICERMLKVEPLTTETRLPRDIPIEQLSRLLAEIELDAHSSHAGVRRTGLIDRAWFLLMLHSGLRTGEVRRIRIADLDLDGRRARIERSKGLRDRFVCLSEAAIGALHGYLDVRGPASDGHVFLYRHLSLSLSYCSERLRTYARRCGVRVTPHQLRHSCATLLLNAGAPILTVQAILGHKHIDTTLGYARLYDGTVAADYYRAMSQIESQLHSQRPAPRWQPEAGYLLALADALCSGTLNDAQRETLHALRAGIMALAPVAQPREAATSDSMPRSQTAAAGTPARG
jgi:integrase